MSGLLAVPAIIVNLRNWTPQLPENYGIRSGILCALLVVCWTQAKGLVDYRELISLIASLIACVVMVCSFISSFFSNYFSLLLLWVFSIFCVNRFVEAEERKTVKVAENAVKQGEGSGGSSALTSLVNAEKFVKLYQSWLWEEETVGTDSESIEEKICKLKIACKELRKVQISIDSLKTQVSYNFHPPMNDSRRVQGLIDKFEHTKAYMELRRYLLTTAQRQLSSFTEKGMTLKVWLSEALEFHENLHSAACRSRVDIRQLSSLLMSIRKDSEVISRKLAEYVQEAQTLRASLQEISACSGIFHKALEGARSQKGKKTWHDILTVSITEEATQVAQRFSRLTKLNACYQAHLNGLLQFTAHRVGDSGSAAES
ncbi:desmoplakin-A-like [Ranitomeya imitator]|uniref:desmoplakin-A-like n=1 Tax=Ranitomeya imitator TaxID=111125 RepID=UPI0037E894F7